MNDKEWQIEKGESTVCVCIQAICMYPANLLPGGLINL
jgi:hypothetical protein